MILFHLAELPYTVKDGIWWATLEPETYAGIEFFEGSYPTDAGYSTSITRQDFFDSDKAWRCPSFGQ